MRPDRQFDILERLSRPWPHREGVAKREIILLRLRIARALEIAEQSGAARTAREKARSIGEIEQVLSGACDSDFTAHIEREAPARVYTSVENET